MFESFNPVLVCEWEFRHHKLCFNFQLRAVTFSAMSAAWLEEHVSNERNAKYSQREFRRYTRKRQLQNIVGNELIKCPCFDLCIPHSTKGPLAAYQGGWKDQFISRASADVRKDIGVLFRLCFFFIFHLWLHFILNFEPKSKGALSDRCWKTKTRTGSGAWDVTGCKYGPQSINTGEWQGHRQ